MTKVTIFYKLGSNSDIPFVTIWTFRNQFGRAEIFKLLIWGPKSIT